MKFITSDGEVIDEYELQDEILETIWNLKQTNFVVVFYWEKEFLEWYLNKKIEYDHRGKWTCRIKVSENITEENELEQLDQLKDYLEL